MKYEDLAQAPGNTPSRLREARFIMQARLAYEAHQSGWWQKATAIAAALGAVVSAAAAILQLFRPGC